MDVMREGGATFRGEREVKWGGGALCLNSVVRNARDASAKRSKACVCNVGIYTRCECESITRKRAMITTQQHDKTRRRPIADTQQAQRTLEQNIHYTAAVHTVIPPRSLFALPTPPPRGRQGLRWHNNGRGYYARVVRSLHHGIMITAHTCHSSIRSASRFLRSRKPFE